MVFKISASNSMGAIAVKADTAEDAKNKIHTLTNQGFENISIILPTGKTHTASEFHLIFNELI